MRFLIAEFAMAHGSSIPWVEMTTGLALARRQRATAIDGYSQSPCW